MKHTNFQDEIYHYSNERVFSIKKGIILLVLLAGLAGIVHIMNTVEAGQEALDVIVGN